MKLAITADLHLTSEGKHPDRFTVLSTILKQCGSLGIDKLIIAGDLFDRRQQNFSEVERRLQTSRPPGLEIIIIPGNHDAGLSPGSLAVEGVTIFSEPTVLEADDGFRLCLVPYSAGSTMGEHLALRHHELDPDQWALISHGDWMGGKHQPSADEPGVYMPLTRVDLALFQPAICLLGHIHRPGSEGQVHYAGSPSPLDVTETGCRRLLLFDTADRSLASQVVASPQIYFDETVVILPLADEIEYLERQLQSRMAAWEVPEGWLERVQVRLKLTGFSSNRAEILRAAEDFFAELQFYPESPDVSELQAAIDVDRNEIARKVKQQIKELDYVFGQRDPGEGEILEQALAVIYGR